jgi:two-component system sensor histidine kinase/response regulator
MSTMIPPLPDFDFTNYTILIVDDNPTNLKVLFDYLEQYGFEILVARDGESALRRAVQAQPDLILLDVVMPGTDGFQTCLRLKARELTRDIPVIFMTALASPDNKVKGFEIGGIDYVTKPLQYEEVLARVTTHLRIRDLQARLESQNTLLNKKNAQLQQEIQARKRIENKLKRLNRQLKEANASKDQLFSIIAHDLRAPFTALLGLSETVIHYIDDYSKADIRKNMLKIRTSSEAVYSLLENLLAWSRLQRGMLKYQPIQVALVDIATNTIDLFRPQSEQKQIRLTNLIEQEVTVYADKSMVETIIRNLLSNALKFSSADDTIEISAKQTDKLVEVVITDTGVGIDPKIMSKLFDKTPYTHVGTAGEHGTGLGLGLCKEFVEKSGGDIWVESEVGKGTTFRFTLPRLPTPLS